MKFEICLSRFEGFCNILETISEKVVTLIMMLMTCIVFAEVITRMFLNYSVTWSGELARFLLIWLIFISASIAQKRGELIAIEFFLNLYSMKFKEIIRLVCNFVVLWFVVLVSITGFSFLKAMIKYNQMSPGLAVPIWVMYLGFYIGIILMVFYSVLSILKTTVKLRSSYERLN